MARTPEQREADARLEQAVTDCARAYGFLVDGAVVVDHVTVVDAVRYDEDPDDFEEFRGVLYKQGATRTSVAIGLLRLGEQMVGEEAIAAQFPPSDGDNP